MKYLARNSGFTLIEILAVLAIGTVVTLAGIYIFDFTATQQHRAITLTNIDVFRRNLVMALNSEKAWSRTKAGALNSTGMTCLNSGTACTQSGLVIKKRAFALYDSVGGLVYDATRPENGVNSQGVPCNTFSASGNSACPFRFDLDWSAICDPANCVSPQIEISAKLVFAPAAGDRRLIFDPLRYSVQSLYVMPELVLTSASVCPGFPAGIPIRNAADFAKMTDGASAANPNVYCLLNDIVLTPTTQPKLGILRRIQLIGYGHSILGLQINGLFSTLMASTVSDIAIESPDFSPPPVDGALLAKVSGNTTLRNIRIIKVPAGITLGGPTAYENSLLVASASGSDIRGIYIEPNGLTLTGAWAGVVAGQLSATKVTDTVVNGTVNARGTNGSGIGAIVGLTQPPSQAMNLHYRGDFNLVTRAPIGVEAVGLLFGWINASMSMQKSSSISTVSLDCTGPLYDFGGIAGRWGNAIGHLISISDSSVDINLTGSTVSNFLMVAPFIGYAPPSGLNSGSVAFTNIDIQSNMLLTAAGVTRYGTISSSLTLGTISRITARSTAEFRGPVNIQAAGAALYVLGPMALSDSTFDTVFKSDHQNREFVGVLKSGREYDPLPMATSLTANTVRFSVESPVTTAKVISDYSDNSYAGATMLPLNPIVGNPPMGQANAGGAPALARPVALISGSISIPTNGATTQELNGFACEATKSFPVFVLISAGSSPANREVLGVATTSAATLGDCAGNSTGNFSFTLPWGMRAKYYGQFIYAEAFGRFAGMTTLLPGSGLYTVN